MALKPLLTPRRREPRSKCAGGVVRGCSSATQRRRGRIEWRKFSSKYRISCSCMTDNIITVEQFSKRRQGMAEDHISHEAVERKPARIAKWPALALPHAEEQFSSQFNSKERGNINSVHTFPMSLRNGACLVFILCISIRRLCLAVQISA